MFGLRKECLNMLNEGYALYKSLERCGIRLINRHPDIKEPGRKEGLIVGLDKNGRVDRIEYRKAEDVSKLWTTREGMQNSFPVLKLQRPLWKVEQDDPLRKKLVALKKDETEKRKLLNDQDSELNITSVETSWWQRILERVKILRPFFETTIQDYMALPQLMDRFLLTTKIDDFAKELLSKLRQVQHEVPYTLFENILIGNKWHKKKQEYFAEIPLILDVNNWENYSIRVASPKLEDFASDCLFKMQDDLREQENDKTQGTSALSGEILLLEDDKFPSPKLPIIGNAYLFSVNDQTPCQTRYKKSKYRHYSNWAKRI